MSIMKYESAHCALENRHDSVWINQWEDSIVSSMPTVSGSFPVAMVKYPDKSNLRKNGLTHGKVEAAGA